MQPLYALFGFTTVENTLWNLAAYAAFIGIIIGVLYAPLRNILITAGAFVLACYAAFLLKDPVFAVLQTLITASGLLQLFQIDKKRSMAALFALTGVALFLLGIGGALQNIAMVIGVFGLLGIAFGLMVLPRRNGFLLMTAGGLLLIVYAWNGNAWVFFWLNIFFVLANVKEFRAART